MALTTAESQKLQETYNLATQVNANAQKLYEIFSAGGVTNPDLAVLKAELDSKMVHNTGTENISGFKTLTNTLYLKNSSIISYLDATDYNTLDSSLSNDKWVIYINGSDKNMVTIGSLELKLQKLPDVIRVQNNLVIRQLNDVYRVLGLQYDITNNFVYAMAPTVSTDFAYNEAVVTQAYLNNTGNSVVHKTNNETINGQKTFTSPIYVASNNNSDGLLHILPIERGQNYTSSILKHGSVSCYTARSCSVSSYFNFGTLGLHLFQDKVQYGMFIYNPYNTIGNQAGLYFVELLDAETQTLTNTYMSVTTSIYVDGNICSFSNNVHSLGISTRLWSEVYAGNGTIQTSDENLKTEIQDIPEAVLRAWGKVKFQQFKFKDAVEKKGIESARIHIGAIAQRVDEAFKSEGLDARKYGLFCWDEWEDTYNDETIEVSPAEYGDVKVVDAQAIYNTVYNKDGTETQVLVSPEKSHMEKQVIKEAVTKSEKKLVIPAGSRYSLRYEQCLCLECAYQRWRLEQLEAKLK